MAEPNNIVSSPRWKSPNGEDRTDGGETQSASRELLEAGSEDVEGKVATPSNDESHALDTPHPTEPEASAAADASAQTPHLGTAAAPAGTPQMPGADQTAIADESDGGVRSDASLREHTSERRAETAPTEPSVLGALRNPLLVIAAVCGVGGGLWSYSALESTRGELAEVTRVKTMLERSLEETRAQLSEVTQAKQAVEATLAETQSKLSIAEKTVEDVKAAIAAAAAAVDPSSSAGKAGEDAAPAALAPPVSEPASNPDAAPPATSVDAADPAAAATDPPAAVSDPAATAPKAPDAAADPAAAATDAPAAAAAPEASATEGAPEGSKPADSPAQPGSTEM